MVRLHLFVVVLFALPFVAQAKSPFHVSGYVTSVQTSGAFDIEGVHIRITPATEYRTRLGTSTTTTSTSERPTSFYPGESLDADGQLDQATHTLTATQIVLVAPSPASVDGTAIIDFIPPLPAALPASDRIVRADGFLLHITAKTKLNFTAPLTSIADIATNQ